MKELDLTKNEFLGLVSRALELKRHRHEGTIVANLSGANIALIFEKSSTRTRCSFEVAAHDHGAHVTYLGPDGSHIGTTESIKDTARVLGRMFDGIEFRGFAQETLEELADYAGVPVWNGLSDQWHPTQMLADVMTMNEFQPGRVEDISYAFMGDGRNNVARSLLVTGAMLGMDVRICAPLELWPPEDVQATARALALTSGARITITDDPVAGVRGADFIYTDVWVSMGESTATWDHRVPLLLPYRVTTQLMGLTGKPNTHFMHCLPALHDLSTDLGRSLHDRFTIEGAEVTDEVFESANSVVFEQAENRLHTISAVIEAGLATSETTHRSGPSRESQPS